MQLIDTHVHLNFDVFQSDLPSVRRRWQEAGVVHLVHSCVEPSEFPRMQAIAKEIPEISIAVGLHPLDAQKWDPSMGREIKRLATSDSRVVAIGETGLDFYKADNEDEQREAFESQLAIACELNLPVIIHCREAAVKVREILQKWRDAEGGNLKGVMHCWGGTPEETQWFLDLGLYISFSGTVTFKNAKKIQASAAMVRGDRLLIETDCPFLSPTPKRHQKRNEPSHVLHVAEKIAALRNTTLEDIATKSTKNACELFNLDLLTCD